MKKGLVLSLLLMFVFCGYVSARTIYDKRGKIVQDGTIRGQRYAAYHEAELKEEAAAAAKLDYDAIIKMIESASIMKSNYYQDVYK